MSQDLRVVLELVPSFGCVVALVAALVALVVGTTRRRLRLNRELVAYSRQAADWAARSGWRYTWQDPALPQAFWGEPFTTEDGFARNVVSGRVRGVPVTIFEYIRIVVVGYHRYSGRPRVVYRTNTVVAVALRRPVPIVEVTKRAVFAHRSGGLDRVDTGDEEFDDHFRVATNHPGFAGAVVTPEVRGLLSTDRRSAGPKYFGLRFENRHLLGWREGRLDLPWALSTADLLVSVLRRTRQPA